MRMVPASLSRIRHAASSRSTTYGAIAAAATGIAPPADVKLKDPKDWTIVGQPVKRIDTLDKLDGSLVYGMDLSMPGMLVAVPKACPVHGGKLKSFDAAAVSATTATVSSSTFAGQSILSYALPNLMGELAVIDIDGADQQPHGLGILDRQMAEAAGARDRDPLAGPGARFLDALVGGDAGADDRGRFPRAESGRDVRDIVRIGQHIFGKPAILGVAAEFGLAAHRFPCR